MTVAISFRSRNSLPSPELGLLTLAHISVLGQHWELDELATVWAELYPVATVVLMDLQHAEAHSHLTELTLHRALLAFCGLMRLQQVLLHALLAHRTPDLLVPILAVLIHLPL